MDSSAKIRIEDILNRVELYRPELDEDLLRHAYVFAANRHQGQVRRSGEAYFTHPLTVAWILAEMELDEVAIAAGLLHDLLEDTETTAGELELEFGPDVTRLVAALTKLSDFESSFSSREATEAENFRRLLLASMDDVRVILVKLADRLHNMRTLGFLGRDRQVAIAQETLDIYAPIANRLGIGSIKMEMEDLCFRHLHPEQWERLEHEIKDRADAADRWFAEIRSVIEGLLAEHGISGSVQGRVKHMYSVYQKLRRQGVDVANVFDFLAFRIIVESVGDCYAVLGLIHQQWPPVPGRMKDHIAIPKPNAYQSLHTTVLGPEAHPFEIQIRTRDMHKIAEFGIAAHWSYKEKGSGAASEDSRISWLRSLLDNSEGASPREFLDSIKVDLYPDDVYCFTPRGDVYSFPRGATILDFAYRIHSEVGHSCVGGRVNGRWVPLRTELKNGDIVEISTSPQQRPHHDWLNLVATNRARAKIRSWLKREERDRAVEVGRKLVERELRRVGASWRRATAGDEFAALLASHGMSREEDLLAAVGFGRLAASGIVSELVPGASQEAVEEPEPGQRTRPPTATSEALEVTGDADFLVYVARCCRPLPGESIVGFVTRGKGVAVHSRSCPNVRNLMYHPEREIEVKWASNAAVSAGSPSRVEVDMDFDDRSGMLASISQLITAEGSDILSCQLRTEHNDRGFAAMTIMVRDAAQLERIMARLGSLNGMRRVERRGQSQQARA
ncbi:MAG: bifunctional (p)ppGpp synthetase/guanosine-3',5'-bis(diphosphate) 3'-pyrophosphohydrolase [Thermoanaerobaculales bacterium]|jgi:GTP pyrophosphokinase|nr:bifunctional (p)ppGpp synthetase/guanosine-3',5'-bis(diphosphate) 3'-pyrophosphohydrolase [Thermoanaerobaculales bacterium]